MFILTTISDLIQISPEDFRKPSAEAIEDNINAKYANKVIQKIGLCICMYDLLTASEGLIGHGTGIVNVNGSMMPSGRFERVWLSVITGSGVSSDHLPTVQRGDHSREDQQLIASWPTDNPVEQTWIWENDGTQLYFDVKETVRFRVESEEWNDQSPVAPVASNAGASTERKSPYAIQGSMSQAGLGLISWW
ncbi:MAG: DNA-directed RNA polymerase III subunit rpc25 [Sclerophora amabilis]|nr:MAG: DNA-directed RNA polymerase III subunit rpc25 [Sclerophora amabilis]